MGGVNAVRSKSRSEKTPPGCSVGPRRALSLGLRVPAPDTDNTQRSGRFPILEGIGWKSPTRCGVESRWVARIPCAHLDGTHEEIREVRRGSSRKARGKAVPRGSALNPEGRGESSRRDVVGTSRTFVERRLRIVAYECLERRPRSAAGAVSPRRLGRAVARPTRRMTVPRNEARRMPGVGSRRFQRTAGESNRSLMFASW